MFRGSHKGPFESVDTQFESDNHRDPALPMRERTLFKYENNVYGALSNCPNVVRLADHYDLLSAHQLKKCLTKGSLAELSHGATDSLEMYETDNELVPF